VGEEVERYITRFGGSLLALAAIVGPFQSLVELSLPYLLATTLVSALCIAALAARQLADWSRVLRTGPGFRQNGTPKPKSGAWPPIALGLVCLCFVIVAWSQVNFVALRITVADGPRPVATFTAPLRAVAHMQINPPGADFDNCNASDLTPKGSREIDLRQQDWIPGKAIAALVIIGFVAPQVLQLDCGPTDAYLPPVLGPSDLVVLEGMQLLWTQLAIIIVGGSLWVGAVFRWRSLRR
jgi:hypothetical protein